MKKINIKTKTVLWTIIAVFALISIILCSIIINNANHFDTMHNVEIYGELKNIFPSFKQYSIGILAFSIIVFIIGCAISFLGFKSWKYSATL